jgi:hypothetical protein
MKNYCGKMTKPENAYEVWENDSGWTWYVLKKYQSPDKEKTNRFARWMCAVSSPFTFGGMDYGDTYINDILRNGGRLVKTNYPKEAAVQALFNS